MKRKYLILIPSLILFLYSCKKDLILKNTALSYTSDLYFKISNTGVTLFDAKEFARNFLQGKNSNELVIIKEAETITQNGIPYFHIINANKGFVIVSPDSLYVPVLAYDSINNFSFSPKNLNPGLITWLNKHAYELDYVRNNKNYFLDSIARQNKLLWAFQAIASNNKLNKTIPNFLNKNKNNGNGQNEFISDVPISHVPVSWSTNSTVKPLCQTLWGQTYPFNYFCPSGSGPNLGGHTLAGCVPIAIAQIMYFWHFPNTYNWSSMPLNRLAAGSQPAGGDMPRLIHDTGSSTEMKNVCGGFNSFGYTSASTTNSLVQQTLSGAEDGTTFSGLITNEIQTNKRPCILSGFTGYSGTLGILPQPTGDGHAWVCDGSNVTNYYFGYTDTYQASNGQTNVVTYYTTSNTYSLLHMNWGWEDAGGATDQTGQTLSNNGWYNCNLNYTQASSSSSNFQYFQIIIYNIHP